MKLKIPAVFIDANGHTAIAARRVTQGHLYLIRMEPGPLSPLVVLATSIERLGFKLLPDYPAEKAAAQYLEHRAGVNHLARELLEEIINCPTPAAGHPIQQQVTNQEEHTMTIEQTLERLATAQEQTATHLSGILTALLARNELLATTGAQLIASTAEAPAAEDKPKRTRRTKEQIAADEAAAAAAEAQPEPETTATPEPEPAEEPAASTPAPTEPETFEDEGFDEAPATEEAKQRTHEDVQALFGKLSQSGKRDAAIAVIKGKYGFGGVSKIENDKLNPIYDELAALLPA